MLLFEIPGKVQKISIKLPRKQPSMDHLLGCVLEYFKVSMDEYAQLGQPNPISTYTRLGVYLSWRYGYPLKQIAAYFHLKEKQAEKYTTDTMLEHFPLEISDILQTIGVNETKVLAYDVESKKLLTKERWMEILCETGTQKGVDGVLDFYAENIPDWFSPTIMSEK